MINNFPDKTPAFIPINIKKNDNNKPNFKKGIYFPEAAEKLKKREVSL